MSTNQIIELAKEVVNHTNTLGRIVEQYGYDIAELVHNETNNRSWQVVTWVRRIR